MSGGWGSHSPQDRIQAPQAPLPPFSQPGEDSCWEGAWGQYPPTPLREAGTGGTGAPAGGLGCGRGSAVVWVPWTCKLGLASQNPKGQATLAWDSHPAVTPPPSSDPPPSGDTPSQQYTPLPAVTPPPIGDPPPCGDTLCGWLVVIRSLVPHPPPGLASCPAQAAGARALPAVHWAALPRASHWPLCCREGHGAPWPITDPG